MLSPMAASRCGVSPIDASHFRQQLSNAVKLERLASEKHTSSSSSGLIAVPLRHPGITLRNKPLRRSQFISRAVSDEVDGVSTTITEQIDEVSSILSEQLDGVSSKLTEQIDHIIDNASSSYSLDYATPEVHVLSASSDNVPEENANRYDRFVNAALVGVAASYAIAKVLTVDQNYWHGWTVYEIIKYAPLHNWSAYEEALKSNPVLAKMMISGVVYSIGDWMAQCYEGKPVLEFSRTRMLRSGLVGFCLHGSLSHYYYHLCEALFPFKEWWVVPVKVAFDQTIWSAFWNSVYFVVLGCLRFENPATIFSELTATFFPLLTAGWKLWPFAHIITYGLVPVEQRLLWVDCVELVWVTILSMYSNEKAEARSSGESSSSVLKLLPDDSQCNT